MAQRSDRGASAVEFALVSLLLCTILFGILQYGLYFWQLQGGAAAVREAARQSAVGMWDCGELQTQTEGRVPAGGVVTVTRSYKAAVGGATTTEPETGDDVEVTISFSTLTVGFLPMPNDGAVLSEALARVETTTSSTETCA